MTSKSGFPEVSRIVEHSMPHGLRSDEAFDQWFEPLKRRIQVATQEVYDRVVAVLETEAGRVNQEEGCRRRVYEPFLGGGVLIKSARSIRSKIGRQLAQAGHRRSPLTPRRVMDLILGFPDLGRFRVVCGLSSDVECALRVLLDASRTTLTGLWRLDGPVKDYVEDLSRRRVVSGHRARQFAVAVPTGHGAKAIHVEIQLMTTVQQAWDQRNHPIYEWQREGGELPDPLAIREVALAETLYLVDEQASRNWQDFVDCRKKGRV